MRLPAKHIRGWFVRCPTFRESTVLERLRQLLRLSISQAMKCWSLAMNSAPVIGAGFPHSRVPAEWIVPLPPGLSVRDAMIYGTAGFTAAQCVTAIVDRGIGPERGPVVVTGATGGVGSVSVAILAKLGYEVEAVTGKREQHDWLRCLGAKKCWDATKSWIKRIVHCYLLGGRRRLIRSVGNHLPPSCVHYIIAAASLLVGWLQAPN